jgi:hypothetical protein
MSNFFKIKIVVSISTADIMSLLETLVGNFNSLNAQIAEIIQHQRSVDDFNKSRTYDYLQRLKNMFTSQEDHSNQEET